MKSVNTKGFTLRVSYPEPYGTHGSATFESAYVAYNIEWKKKINDLKIMNIKNDCIIDIYMKIYVSIHTLLII